MNSATILIVDDDSNIRELLFVNLTAAGYTVDTAINGADALAILTEKSPDIIILDVMMPEIDGWEVCKVIRDTHTGHTMPKIIFLTARDTDRDKMIGKNILKGDEYITKPFDMDHLFAVIERLLKISN
jgi:DNA-binding response OmpR family regulator